MGPERWKDERPRGAEEERGAEREAGVGEDASARQQAIDPREEEGWSQPESSAQKTPEPESP
jgi:hypothetical protein